jgi:tRNA A22 N-methylase
LYSSSITRNNYSTVTFEGSKDLKDSALKHVLELEAVGGTNINDAMLEGLGLIQKVRESKNILQNNARQVPLSTYLLIHPYMIVNLSIISFS